MVRVVDTEVQGLIGDATFEVTQAIETADAFVDNVLADKGLNSATLDLITLYLAGHFASLSRVEGPLAAQSLGEATERYHDIYGPGLYSTRFGQQAVLFDTSGTLSDLAAKVKSPTRTARITVI